MANDARESPAAIAERIIEIFREQGDAAYVGEQVSQTEHALQAATAAEHDDADCEMITAALLPDIGPLLHDLPENCAETGVDDCHQDLGDRFLRQYFGLRVTEPVRLHVSAKRYLCACKPDYQAQLSPASVTSLRLQGGPFSSAEVAQFEAGEFAREATELRLWDDLAKVPELPTQGLEHFRTALVAALQLVRQESAEPPGNDSETDHG